MKRHIEQFGEDHFAAYRRAQALRAPSLIMWEGNRPIHKAIDPSAEHYPVAAPDGVGTHWNVSWLEQD
jgi:hypothetical protein